MRLKSMVFVAILTLLLACTAMAQAADFWVTDPKTGAKIGWNIEFLTLTSASWSGPVVDGKAEGQGMLVVAVALANGDSYTGQLEAEMVAGKLHGKAKAKWSNGDTFDGYFADGLFDGKGVYKFASRGGRIYEGEFLKGQQHGYGIYKEANGKVLYEGQWVEGVPATRPSLDKVMGIRWGASEDEVKKAVLARPNTTLRYAWKDGTRSVQQYWGPFNDKDYWLFFRFNEGKLYGISIHFSALEAQLDQVMERLEATRKGVTDRYGPADEEKGKYLDAKQAWYWPGKYAITLGVTRQSAPAPGFGLWLNYADVPAMLKAEGKAAAAAKSDF